MATVIATCLRLLRLTPIVVLLAPSADLQASELDKELDWFLDPGEVILVQAGQEAQAKVQVRSRAGALPPGLRLHATFPKLEGEERRAWIGFEPDEKAWVEVRPKKDDTWVPVAFSVRGLTSAGVYVAEIVARAPDGRTSSPLAFSLYRPPPARFEPTLTGPGVNEEGAVSLRDDATGQAHQLVVQRPDEIDRRPLQFAFVSAASPEAPAAPLGEAQASTADQPAAAGDPRVVFEPNPLTSNDKIVKLTVRELPDNGLDGFIRISDAEDHRLARFIPAVITPQPASFTRLQLIMFVIAGAILSVLLNTALPASISKRRKHERVMSIRQQIQQCTDPGSSLHLALNVEQNRIRKISGDIQWFSASKQERFEELDELIGALAKKVDIALAISNLRKSLNRLERISSRFRRIVQEHLSDAEHALLDEQPEIARGCVEAAQEIKDKSDGQEAFQDLRTKLPKDIADLLDTMRAHPVQGSDPNRARLLERLEGVSIGPGTRDEELLEIERDYDRAVLHHKLERDVLERHPQMPGLEDQRARFVKLVNAGEFEQAASLLQLLVRGLTPQAVYEALDRARASIVVHPEVPEERQSAGYSVHFAGDEPALNTAPVQSLMSFEWTFHDGSAKSTGARSVHHFPLTRPWPPPWGEPVLWFRRRIGGGYHRKVTMRIEMTDPAGSAAPKVAELNQPIAVRGSTGRGFGLSAMEFMTFALSTAIAVLAAYGAEQADLVTNATWSAAITAALFGFGLDQIRDRSLNPSTA